MKTINKITGISLIIGGFLQMVRMMPIAMSDGIKMLENFPPHNLEDTLFAAQASGWHISHIMVFLAAPLLITGFYGLHKLVTQQTNSGLSILALIGLSMGVILYNIGAVIDGLFLPEIGRHIIEVSGIEKERLGALATYTHEFAISFGGLAFAHLLISTGIMGQALQKVEGFKIFGFIGLAIGVIAFLGYLTGILDLMVTGSFMLTGGLTMFMFIFYFVLGIKVFRLEA